MNACTLYASNTGLHYWNDSVIWLLQQTADACAMDQFNDAVAAAASAAAAAVEAAYMYTVVFCVAIAR